MYRALRGKTIFITGASRGIGKAIALRAAQDGANIVIAAKTAEPNPKLPGTIYTAAKEIEAAGGKCLPCIVDIRYEDQVRKAVQAAVDKFGGIDVLVNNASAINLTGTLETGMKKYDLMMSINGRGTYLCSHVCLPYLLKSKNPHILNISPPLSMKSKWFKNHVAYTKAKYGMSMCALGMSEEFKSEGVAVNCLWPKTMIYTAAVANLMGGESSRSYSRKPDVMSDAAYIILCKDSRSYTGNFAIDEEVLKKNGVTDMDQYAYVPGNRLQLDFFLDLDEKELDLGASGSGGVGPDRVFQQIKGALNKELVSGVGGVFQFNLTGKDGGSWYVDLKNGSGSVGKGAASDPQCILTMDSEDFIKMFAGELKSTAAYMAGKLKIKGNMGLAMKLEKLTERTKSKNASVCTVEAAGGKCLPCIVDICYEDQVRKAVQDAVDKFGGIDVLVNNASAISLTGTLETGMKKYDLLNNINGRGTYLCSRVCLPHLLKSKNPHILNISLPLNMNSKWFKDHVAHTFSKYGMSMCALGMAKEFKSEGVAVNCLWPKKGIYTAAVAYIGGDGAIKHCRKPEIMSDAAYVILTKDSRSYTGNFAVDEEVLKQNGVTDMDHYAHVPGNRLAPCRFLEPDPDGTDIESLGVGGPDRVFQQIKGALSKELVSEVGSVLQFNVTGKDGGSWYVDLKNGSGSVGKGAASDPQCILTMNSEDFIKMFAGELKSTAAYMAGKLKIKGNMGLAMKLEKLTERTKSKL
ncbi:hypothetical protein FSP39_008712 [Pinctada imbricata]|uniref:Hydroxysteroid dehydrogenase-like protein 2 n=1 Tax=Pinctada imbricata TaxID=66713 RepID=A0AA88XZP2_PINIB|nr:hypothetical protein FSP39_008712 [Pinctada imbricata]